MRSITVLLDTNVPLDSFLDRKPFSKNAKKILTFCGEHTCKGFIAAHSLTNIFYILPEDFLKLFDNKEERQ
jgi:hypothetical protein